MPELGTVNNHGFDKDGRERREQLEAVVDCDTCGKEVDLWSETESWGLGADNRWHHQLYGPAQGVCCQNLYIASFEGCFQYQLTHES